MALFCVVSHWAYAGNPSMKRFAGTVSLQGPIASATVPTASGSRFPVGGRQQATAATEQRGCAQHRGNPSSLADHAAFRSRPRACFGRRPIRHRLATCSARSSKASVPKPSPIGVPGGLSCFSHLARAWRALLARGATGATWRSSIMAKGQQAPKTNNKPKLSVKEKKQKKKEKAAAKAGRC